MARAHRPYIPGQIWHITHRCHKREFLLKFAKDRHRWLQWLYQARKRYGLTILIYTVTSNHIHLTIGKIGSMGAMPKFKPHVASASSSITKNGVTWPDTATLKDFRKPIGNGLMQPLLKQNHVGKRGGQRRLRLVTNLSLDL